MKSTGVIGTRHLVQIEPLTTRWFRNEHDCSVRQGLLRTVGHQSINQADIRTDKNIQFIRTLDMNGSIESIDHAEARSLDIADRFSGDNLELVITTCNACQCERS